MNTEPDGVEVVGTRAEAAAMARPPLLVVDAVTEYLESLGIGEGGIAWQRIGDGQSNITYRVRRGSADVVLRRGPRPPHPRSTHDMAREARIQQLLRAAGAPVPQIIAVHADEDVLGVPFYVMEHLDGIVVTDEIPVELSSPDQRTATVDAAVDALVDLHRIDVTHGDLAGFGRPDGYLGRQVKLFSSLWEQNTRRDIPEVARIGEWLASDIPETQAPAVVHGDFRIGNLMYRPESPARVVAVLDWEMATLGDPLADLGYLTATYATAGEAPNPMHLTSVTREAGYPQREDLVARYVRGFDLDVSRLAWYQTLALWKAAIFCEAMFTRWLDGERPGDTFAPTLETGVPALLEAAREMSGR